MKVRQNEHVSWMLLWSIFINQLLNRANSFKLTAFLFVFSHSCIIYIRQSNTLLSNTTWYYFPKWVANGSKEQSGRADCSAGVVWHPQPPSYYSLQLCQNFHSVFSNLLISLLEACKRGANLDFDFRLWSVHYTRGNDFICWHRDTRQVKTRLSSLLLLL